MLPFILRFCVKTLAMFGTRLRDVFQEGFVASVRRCDRPTQVKTITQRVIWHWVLHCSRLNMILWWMFVTSCLSQGKLIVSGFVWLVMCSVWVFVLLCVCVSIDTRQDGWRRRSKPLRHFSFSPWGLHSHRAKLITHFKNADLPTHSTWHARHSKPMTTGQSFFSSSARPDPWFLSSQCVAPCWRNASLFSLSSFTCPSTS